MSMYRLYLTVLSCFKKNYLIKTWETNWNTLKGCFFLLFNLNSNKNFIQNGLVFWQKKGDWMQKDLFMQTFLELKYSETWFFSFLLYFVCQKVKDPKSFKYIEYRF